MKKSDIKSNEVKETSVSKRFVAALLVITYVSILTPFSIFAQGGEKIGEYIAKQSEIEETEEVLISAEKGGKVSLGFASIEIPEGALKEDTKISITRLRKVEDTGDTLYNAIPRFGGYRFLPAGTKFEKDVTITLPYNPMLNKKPQSLEDLYTYFFDTEKKSWVKLERIEVDQTRCLVRSLTTHFTDMINATLTLPEAASPVDINLNSIKNLEAAKPDSHLIKFNPPKAINSGDATFSFELGIPSGRHGMQPQISISYSSAGGNGIMGKGFDVNYASSITTDTRFGVPKYNVNDPKASEQDKDKYMLDGILLEEQSKNNGEIVYKPLKESSFSKIVRHNAGKSNDYWEVTDKNGSKRIYEFIKKIDDTSEEKIFTWNLVKTYDVRGNNVIYEYLKGSDNYVYPDVIYYTGDGSKKGNYFVKFNYFDELRKDIRIDARSGEIVSCTKLLKSIETYYKDTKNKAIRTYEFKYTPGLALENKLEIIKVSNSADESYEYSFDYVQPVKDADNKVKYFGELEEVESNYVKEWDNGKPLQTGNSTSVGSNFTESGGLGYGLKEVDLRITGGTSGSKTKGESYTHETLMDINGDGRVDSIREQNSNYFVSLNNGAGFDREVEIIVKNGTLPSRMDYTENSDSTRTWNIYGGAGAKNIPLSGGISYSEVKQDSISKTLTSFIDMDRDGLVDIVQTGKSTYLKNLGETDEKGNIIFDERNISSIVEVGDLKVKLDGTVIKEYQKTYYVQTPFRMWKAPYDGIVSITEQISNYESNSSNTEVAAYTIYGDKYLATLSTKGTNKKTISQDIDEFGKLYFITNNTIEPLNTDVNWNIKIDYTDIRSFSKKLPHPYVDFESYKGISYPIIKENNNQDTMNSYKKDFINNVLNGESDLCLLYDFKYKDTQNQQTSSNYSTDYEYYVSYKDISSLSEENQIKVYEALKRLNKLIPTVFTESQFNEYFNSVQSAADKKSDEEKKEFYTKFARSFSYDVVSKLYRYKKTFETESDYWKKYPISNELIVNALQNYVINNVEPSFTSKDIIYQIKASEKFNNFRSLTSRGTIAGNYINVGSYENKDLFINVNTNKLGYFENIDDLNTFKTLDNGSVSVDPNTFEVTYKVNDAADTVNKEESTGNKEESTVKISLEKISYRPENITRDEYLKLIDLDTRFNDKDKNASNSFWKLNDNSEEKDRIIVGTEFPLFANMSLTDSQKSTFMNAMYEKKTGLKIDSNNSVTETYEYYVNKSNRDLVTAQKVLDEYRIAKNEADGYFPCYSYDNNTKNYLLKDIFKTKQSNDSFYKEHREEVTKDISSENMNSNEYETLIRTKLDEKYKSYCKIFDAVENRCKTLNFGNCSEVVINQRFNKNYLNHITSKKYEIIKLNNGCNFAKYVVTISDQISFDSAGDYSNKNINVERELYKYTELINTNDYGYNNTDDTEVVCSIGNDDYLYGGTGGWFCGIWKGSLNDIPFSVKNLESFSSISSGKDFENAKSSLKESQNSINAQIKKLCSTDNTNTTNTTVTKQESNVHFYLPCVKEENQYVKDLNTVYNPDAEYTKDTSKADLSKAILGTVAVNSDFDSKEPTGLKNYYRMPFIYKDIIHADRAGGSSYYEIEGIEVETNSNQTAFSMPSIRGSHNEGKDRTPKAEIKAGPMSIEMSFTINDEGEVNANIDTAISRAEGSCGTNKTTSTSNQMLQDINGDGIPDIVQVVNEGDSLKLKITEGYKVDESGNIQFNKISYYNNVPYISENKTDTTVFGGSISATGSVKVVSKPTSKGNIKSVLIETQASPNASASITYSQGTSTQYSGINDINGDGLSDYFNGNTFRINNGSDFKNITFKDKEEDFYGFKGLENLSVSSSNSFGTNFVIGVGPGGTVNLSEASSLRLGVEGSVGLTYNSSSSNTTKMMMDINGDGLQDILEMQTGGSLISVKYNTGNSFVKGDDIILPGWGNIVKRNLEKFSKSTDENQFNLAVVKGVPVLGALVSKESDISSIIINPFGFKAETNVNSLEWNTNVSVGINGNIGLNFNHGIDFFVLFGYVGTLNITAAAGGGANASTSVNGVSVRMMDLDGDGLPDHVMRIPGVGTYWKKNISGTYGQLAQINMPQGGNVQIEYEGVKGTVQNPGYKYVMKAVTVNDGCDENGVLKTVNHGEHSTRTEFNYGFGYYDRQTKESYGFTKVTTISPNGTIQNDEYNYGIYYLKGALKKSEVIDAETKLKISENTTTYCEAPYALPQKEETNIYEVSSGEQNYITTTTTYKYDLNYGNCTEIVQDFGKGEKITGKISYSNNEQSYIIGLPVSITVLDKNGKTIRRREGSYNKYGELEELKQYYKGNAYIKNTISYDSLGNIVSITDGNNASTVYEYDEEESMFPVKITRKGNNVSELSSKIEYDVSTQTKKKEIDSNGNSLRYEYDKWQRITEIYTSYDEKESNPVPAVSYEYHVPEAETSTDSEGKTVAGKRDFWYAVTNNKVSYDKDSLDDESTNPVIQTVVQIDGLGRTVRLSKTGYVKGVSGWNTSGAVEYDKAGRTVTEGMIEFVAGTLEHLLMSEPSMTELCTKYEYDVQNRPVKTILPDGNIQTASFTIYNGKLISTATDPLGTISEQWTDSRGNIIYTAKKKTEDGDPLTKATYEYNSMGEMESAKILGSEKYAVKIEYDILGRRTAIESADSGRQEYEYDNCSNLIKETNSELRNKHQAIYYTYDGLNRLKKIEYPDSNENVSYVYGDERAVSNEGKNARAFGKILSVEDASGTLSYEYGMLGEVRKETRTIKSHINEFDGEKTAVMQYCSDYLGRMQYIIYPDGETIKYGYDEGGQVKSVRSFRDGKSPVCYVSDIKYDKYGQRIRIEYGNGTFTDYEYDPARRWLESIKTENSKGLVFQNIKYNFNAIGNINYYENDCLDAVSGNYKTKQEYKYDDLYQLTSVEGWSTFNPLNNVISAYDSHYSQTFAFDSAGLGRMMSKDSEQSVNADVKLGDNLNYKLKYVYDDEKYAHRLLKVDNCNGNSNDDRYYKYDLNGNIVCEQDGDFTVSDETYHEIVKEGEDVYSTDYGWGMFGGDAEEKSTRYRRVYTWNAKNQLVNTSEANGTKWTSYVYGNDGQRSNKYSDKAETMYFNKMWILSADRATKDYGGRAVKNIYLGETRIVTKFYECISMETERTYYYHSDHLGSASLITDNNGEEYQRIEYTPYGEIWIEHRRENASDTLPYKFTAKELDEETGLYYYGARYLDPKYSLWISTDPALGDYIPGAGKGNLKDAGSLPGMGGVFNPVNFNLYHYAGNNPIKYTDPDGRYSDEWINKLPASVKQYTKNMPPNRFSQQLWTVDKGFKSYMENGKEKFFWQTACLATSILNIVSEAYQKETGNIMTEVQAIEALNAAIDSGCINEDNAYVSDIAGAANAMANSLKMKGSFRSNEKSPTYMIYAIDKGTYSHFVNALKNVIGSQYFDVWDAKTKDYLKLTTNEAGEEITQNLINLQKNRPIRGLDYNIPYKNWSMIDRESMEK